MIALRRLEQELQPADPIILLLTNDPILPAIGIAFAIGPNAIELGLNAYPISPAPFHIVANQVAT